MLASAADSPDSRPYMTYVHALCDTMPAHRHHHYVKSGRRFQRFCRATDRSPLPASTETVLRYIASLKRSRYLSASIEAMLLPVCAAHEAAGYPSPRKDRLVSITLKGMSKEDPPPRIAPPMPPDEFAAFMHDLPMTRTLDLRTRATTACLYWGMLCATELATLNLDFADRSADRWVFRNVGAFRKRTIIFERTRDSALCPITALKAYLARVKIREGPVWRNVGSREPLAPMTHFTLAHYIIVSLKSRSAFQRYSPDSFKNGALEEAFHRGVPWHDLVRLAGYCDLTQLFRRLRQIVTMRPGDRLIPHGGQRARRRPRGPKRLWHSDDK